MEQREVDNMLLSMIQKHFPSLPLSDEYTDWGKWLGFARAVYESGRASPASAPEGWKQVPAEILDRFQELNPSNYDHDDVCAMNAWAVELVLATAPTPPVSEDRKDAERFRFMLDDHAEKTTRQRVRELFERLPVMSLSAARAAIDAAMQEDKP